MHKIAKGVGTAVIVLMTSMGSVLPGLPAYAADRTQQAAQETPTTSYNELSQLEIDGVQFEQAFSPSVKEYTATVENSIDHINLLVRSNHANSVMTVNGKSAINGEPIQLSVQTGINTFIIKVDDGIHSENTYTLTVTREKSSNNLLNQITLSTGELSPAFAGGVLSYQVRVANDVDHINIRPELSSNSASVTVNNIQISDKGTTVKIPVGISKITIVVTAEDGEKKVYTIKVIRNGTGFSTPVYSKPTVSQGKVKIISGHSQLAASKNQLSSGKVRFQSSNLLSGKQTTGKSSVIKQKASKAKLSALSVSKGTWNKSFSSTSYTYHIAVAKDVNFVTINGNAAYSGSTIKIEGSTVKTIQLPDQKKTIISVLVTNGEDRKTYVLVFNKKITEAAEESNATIDNGTSGTAAITSVLNTSTSAAISSTKTKANDTSTSFWSRFVSMIRSFFQKF